VVGSGLETCGQGDSVASLLSVSRAMN